MNYKSIITMSVLCAISHLYGMENKPTQEMIKVKNLQLLCASAKGSLNEVMQLIAEGIADINTKKGIVLQTPLMRASSYGNTCVAKALIEAGADVNIPDAKNNYTALIYAIKSVSVNKCPAPSATNLAELVQALVNAGADVNITDQEGRTLFEYILHKINHQTINYIVDTGFILLNPIAKSIIMKKIQLLLLISHEIDSPLSIFPPDILKIIFTMAYPEFAMDQSTIAQLPSQVLIDNVSLETLSALIKNKILNQEGILRAWQEKIQSLKINDDLPNNDHFLDRFKKHALLKLPLLLAQ